MKGNFLAQFSGPKPEPVMWCLEATSAEGVLIIYVAPSWHDALQVANKLRSKHKGAKVRIVGDTLVNN